MYKKAVEEFTAYRNRSHPNDPSKNYVTRETWLSLFSSAGHKKCLEIIWKAFDADGNDQLTVCIWQNILLKLCSPIFYGDVYEQLDEFLVYAGITSHGTVEQKAMGSFMMLDQDHDHKITSDELTFLMKVSNEMNANPYSEDDIADIVDCIMEIVDKDNVCLIFMLIFTIFYCVHRFRVCLQQSGTLELSEIVKAARKEPKIAAIFQV